MKKKYFLSRLKCNPGQKKLLLIMKLSIVLNLWCTVAFSATTFSQNATVSFNVENAKVKDVFHSIEDQSSYRFFYNDELSDINRVVTMDVKDSKVEEVLDNLFEKSDVSYTILDNNLIVVAPKRAMQQQEVTGVVTDASTGELLIGVSIYVEGTTVGTISDVNGKFTIAAEQGQVLVFSFVGYMSQKVIITGSSMNVQLSPDVKSIDEVVVVGYGTMKKLDVSGSIVSTNANVIKEVPSASVTSALQGRLPGIEMAQTSTRPGSAMQIRIRGERSLNASNDPLIVVDGIPFQGSISDIVPSDIKSIDILKDASATAIYGSRGANGVILITTNRGRMNSSASVKYDGYYGIKTVAKKYEVYNGAEFQAFKHATINTTYKDQYTPLEQEMIDAGKETDWQDLMYKNASVANHDVSVSMGTQSGAFSIGGGYYNETTVLPGQAYKRYSVRATVDQEIGQYFKVGLSSQNSYAITEGESASMMYNILTLSPLMPAYNNDGSIRQIPTEGHVDKYYNPLLFKNENLWREQRNRFANFNSLFGEVKFTNELKYRVNLGLSYYQENYGNFYAPNTPVRNGSVSSASVQNKNFISWTVENLLYYDKVFAEKHRVNATLMYSAEQSEFNKSQMNAEDISAEYLQYYNLGLADGSKTIKADEQDYYKKGLLSGMGRVQYAFDDRYSLTATLRRDGASVLASGHKWHNYTAFSAAWNLANESFLKENSIVNQLKLRLGYGETSNQAVNAYSTLGKLTQVPYNYGSTNVYGAYVTDLPNSSLGWEYTKNYNFGIDFGFMQDRITGYIDIYKQKTSDVLFAVQLPQSSGVINKVWQNVGKTENKGFEFSVSAQVIKPENKGDFEWIVDFNIYANRNEISELNSGVKQDIGNGFFVGQPINVIYDYQKLGIIQENEAPYLGTYAAGKIKVADLNNDGLITADGDRKILGSFEPDFAGGISTRLAYKGFDFSVVSFYKKGGMLISTIHMPHSYYSTNNGRRNSIKVDYWTPENPDGKYPQPGNQTSAEQDDWGSTLGYFDASYWKIRTITLGYTFESNLLNRVNCKDARIYLTCQNPFTLFSPYMKEGGLDPEATGTGAQGANTGLTGGITSRALTIGANTPPTRNFLIGLSVKF